jgi:hypothetical protein
LPDKNVPPSDLTDVKKRVSDRLMPLDYISGVGTGGSGLKVYLSRALAPDEEHHVKSICDAEAAGKTVEFVKSGEFKAQ